MAPNIFRRKKKGGKKDDYSDKSEEAFSKEEPHEPASDEEAAAYEEETSDPAGGGFYQRLRQGLSKTRNLLTTDIEDIFISGKPLDEDSLEDLEERLITADIGVQPATDLIENISKVRADGPGEIKQRLREKLCSYLYIEESRTTVDPDKKPYVIMVVGVNGVGKTTTIGKLAAAYGKAEKSVMLVAADTFRAAAIEQLSIWAERTHSEIIKHRPDSDPSAVVFDGIEAARARDTDIVLIDTAGRLHTKTNLMEELKKIKRTITKKIPDAPHEILLVLDATTGQNALSQAQLFSEATDVTGFILTKLDGTAKGGIVINLCHTFQIPLKYIGVGEQTEDLQPFVPEKFVDALL